MRQYRLLRSNPQFARFWLARTISVLGGGITMVVLPLMVYAQTKSAFLTSILTAAEVLPYIAFGLFAGALADRVNHRSMMVTSDLLSAICLAVPPFVSLTQVVSAPLLIVVAFASSACAVWFDAASWGAIFQLVDNDELPEANSLLSASNTAAALAAPALAGLMFATIGGIWALAFDALTFLASAALIATLRFRQPTPTEPFSARGIGRDIVQGLRFIVSHAVVRLLTIIGFFASVTGGAISAMIVVLGSANLKLDTREPRMAALFAASAVGAGAATLLYPALARRVKGVPLSLWQLPIGAISALFLAWTRQWVVALIAITLWAAAYTVLIVNGITTRQRETPDTMQSRVGTAGRLLAWGGQPLGALAAGAIASRVGPSTAILIPVAILATVAIVATAANRRL